MPLYEFKCQDCGFSTEWEMAFDEVEECVMLPCTCSSNGDAGLGMETPHRRVYSFGLGPVKGAGGSPGRFGSQKKD